MKRRKNKFMQTNQEIVNAITRKFNSAFNILTIGSLSSEEQGYVSRIENIRNELLHSPDQIELIDFGYGTVTTNRSEVEMDNGVSETESISRCAKASKPKVWALLLFKLVRMFSPDIILELGTNVGISGSYLASAQKINKHGKLITLEGADSLMSIAQKTMLSLGLDNVEIVLGRFKDSLPAVLSSNPKIDFVFIDGHHDYQATKDYFAQILPFMSDQSIMVFDDINWTAGMRKAWSEIKTHKSLNIVYTIGQIGICYLDKNLDTQLHYNQSILSTLLRIYNKIM